MQLDQQDQELFYGLLWSLQTFVNNKRGVFPGIRDVEEYEKLSMVEKAEVRDILWSEPEYIDDFVEENPHNLEDDELAIIENWENFVQGKFVFERQLKKYAVFIKEEDVYAVKGITNPPEESISQRLPTFVETVLLPFQGEIVYDGLMRPHRITIGSNMKHEFKETYMRAKQNKRIIETLDPEKRKKQEQETDRPVVDYAPELETLIEQADELSASSDEPAILRPAFQLLQATLQFAKTANDNPKQVDMLYDELDSVQKMLDRAERIISRIEPRRK